MVRLLLGNGILNIYKYVQTLVPFKCDQEGGLAPFLLVILAFLPFPLCSQEQHWMDAGSLPRFPGYGAPRGQRPCAGLCAAELFHGLGNLLGEPQPSPQAKPCGPGTFPAFLKPSFPNTSGAPGSRSCGFSLVCLLTHTFLRNGRFSHDLPSCFPPPCGINHFGIHRKLYPCGTPTSV